MFAKTSIPERGGWCDICCRVTTDVRIGSIATEPRRTKSPVMSVVGPIAAKILQGRECSEMFLLQQNSLVIRSSLPHRRTPAICGTGDYGIFGGHPNSLRFDTYQLHHFAPLLCLISYELTKVVWRARYNGAPEVGKSHPHFGIDKSQINLLVEHADNL